MCQSRQTSLDLRRGPGARNGPDYRDAPSEESAITRALRRAATAPLGAPIFSPHEGTTFNSHEEARDFYNLYSWEKGFGVRFGRGRKNASKYQTKLDIVFSCEGTSKNSNSSIRTDCAAKIRLHRRSDHAWYISSVNDTHNHRLTEAYSENKQWKSHGYIDPSTKDLIKKLRENNISVGRICNILGVSDGGSRARMRKESVRSICAKLAQENMRDDIGKTLRLLDKMKETDPGLEVRFQIDSGGRLKMMLWCTGKNRLDYATFGDAITFDTTYRTNLYSLPFGLFMGVNNHFQSIVLGGLLLTSEKTSDFEWAFTNFVEIMGGKAPVTMLTDQCAAMAKAMKTSMQGTKHRWCRWHVLKNAKDRLGKVYSKHKRFKHDFNKLITDETNIPAFEKKWCELVKKYKLVKNKFLKRLFKHRENGQSHPSWVSFVLV